MSLKEEILKEMKSDLMEVKNDILYDLRNPDNVDYKTYMKHLGEEKVLLKYLFKLENL